MLKHTAIAFGKDHNTELCEFIGVDRETLRKANVICNYNELGKYYNVRYISDNLVAVLRTGQYTNHTDVFVFGSRNDAMQFIQNKKGNYDIENGNAPFGYQRSPVNKVRK